MTLKQTGSVFDNHGLWYYSVQLPGEKKRRQVPLRAPGARHTMRTDRPRRMAEQAAARYWEEHTRQVKRHEAVGITVAELCALWDAHCREYYKGGDSASNAVLDVRAFREMFGSASLHELTHTDMLKFRDVPFSPVRAMTEHLNAARAARVTPFYGKAREKEQDGIHVPRTLGERWDPHAYGRTIRAACRRAGIAPWGANRLRHAFGTEVRRAFGLDAARAVLGHSTGGRITDLYTFDAIEDEMVRAASAAVEALG